MSYEQELAQLKTVVEQQQEAIRVLSKTISEVSNLQQEYVSMLADKISVLQDAIANLQR